MDQSQMNQPSMQQRSSKTSLWVSLSILLTAIVVGGAVYAWQQMQLSAAKDDLQKQITDLNSKVSDLQKENSSSSGNDSSTIMNSDGSTPDGENSSNSNNPASTTTYKTYTNSKFALSMSIPTECEEINQSDEGIGFKCSIFEPSAFSLLFANTDYFHPTSGTSVSDWMKTRVIASDSTKSISTKNNIDMFVSYSTSCPQAYDSDEYYFINKSQLFQLQFLHSSCETGKRSFITEQQKVVDYIVNSILFK